MNNGGEFVVPIRADVDVVLARQEARRLLAGLRFSSSELTLIATAISEVARNIVAYAGSGEVVLRLLQRGQRRGLVVTARDRGPGIADVEPPCRMDIRPPADSGLGYPAPSV